MAAQLEFVRQRAVAQALSAAQLAAAAPEADQPILAAVQARLEEQARLAASGQTDPAGFRRQVRQRGGDQGDSGEATSPGGGGSQVTGQTPVPTGTCDDAGGYGTGGTLGPSGQGSRTPDRTPQPGGGSGHGP